VAVTVTDNRTVLYSDGLTNITGASATETSFVAELASCAAEAYNIATGQIYWSGTTPNFTTAGNELIYVWSAVVATQNGYKEAVIADSSHAMYLSDGTNDLVIYMAGNDRDVFKHADGQVSFQCFLVDIDYLDTANTNGDLGAIAGTYASFNPATTTMDVGAHYTTLSKALGGGNNCYLDIIRYGGADDGLTIAGGTTGDRGNFQEVCVLDRSTADGRAHGIIREYTGGAYGVQGTLKLGDNGTGTSYFEEDGFSMTFEDRLVADDKYKLVVQGNATGTNVVRLLNATIASARPGVTVDMSDTGINELLLDTCTFQSLKNTWTFPTDTNGTTLDHQARNCTWTGQDLINTGTILMDGCTFLNAVNANGAIEWDATTDEENQNNLTFVSDGTGHAIYINIDTAATTTFNISGYIFDGYATQDGTAANRVFYINNPSDGDIVINLTDTVAINPVGTGTGVSYELAAGTTSSVTINNNVSVTITVQDAATDPIQNAVVSVYNTATHVELSNELTDVNGESTFSMAASTDFYARIRKSTTGSTRYFAVETVGNSGAAGTSLTVTLTEDSIAST
jgi:hypothetical protein